MSKRVRNGNKKKDSFGYQLLLPSTVLFLPISVYPLISGIYMSFTNRSFMRSGQTKLVFLEDYVGLFQGKKFLGGLVLTLVYTTLVVFISYAAGFILTLALNRDMRGKATSRMILLPPQVIPSVVAMIDWSQLLNDQFEFISLLPRKLHLAEKPILSLADYKYTRPTVTLVSVWKSMPSMMIPLLAGLQNAPKEFYEAASMGRTGFFARLRTIILPLMWPVSFISMTPNFIWAINSFENMRPLAGGGPNGHMSTLPVYSYYTAFYRRNLVYAATVVTTLIIRMLLVDDVYFFVKQRGMSGEGGVES